MTPLQQIITTAGTAPTHPSLEKVQGPARAPSPTVSAWMNLFEACAAQAQTAGDFVATGAGPLLRYLFGLAPRDFARHALAHGNSKLLADFEALASAEELNSSFFREFGDALRALWRSRGWEGSHGDVAEVLAVVALTPSYPVSRFFIGEGRIELATEGTLQSELIMRFTRGLSLVSHLRLIGPHPDDGTTELVDNELLAETIREYTERLIEFHKTAEADTPPASFPGHSPLPPTKDVLLWGLAVMLDPHVHNFMNGITSTNQAVLSRWPKGPEQAMQEYFSLALADLSKTPGARELIERAINTEWEKLGFRSPFQFAESYMQLDVVRAQNTMDYSRPTVQRIFSFALPVGAAAIGRLDLPCVREEALKTRELQEKLVCQALAAPG